MHKKNLTRKNLRNKIFQNLGFSKNFSNNLVDNFFNSLVTGLARENKIKISSFGTFKVINKKERIGRNPKTKEEVMIAPRNVISFLPSKHILKKLKNG